ncbi:putative Fe-S cluster assembly protein SufT [Aliikangiella coralliicola]|uniref:Putative Fe-S cluster assembly protein SufT n=2 Tax=Aliikangiella coralliicola TaxID=2592383 RepID=A0A545UDW7_9GAMM|nr:putative Fe-S cluster assembly protein SufT [Aliikangiella coralliicola]
MVVAVKDCPARLVPAGTKIIIPKDTFVTITQALGGNYTVAVNGNMARVDGTDAAALGLKEEKLEFEQPTSDEIIEEQVWQALKSIYDPEIPVNLVDLGLIYSVDIDQQNKSIQISMTLTAPACGMGPVLVSDIKYRVSKVPNVAQVDVELIFEPPWTRDMMSDEAKLETGMFF